MALKKFLRKIKIEDKGQVSLEYVILFSIIAVVTIVSLSTFYPEVKKAMMGDGKPENKGFFQTVVERIIK